MEKQIGGVSARSRLVLKTLSLLMWVKVSLRASGLSRPVLDPVSPLQDRSLLLFTFVPKRMGVDPGRVFTDVALLKRRPRRSRRRRSANGTLAACMSKMRRRNRSSSVVTCVQYARNDVL